MSIFPLPVFEQDADPSRRDGMTVQEQAAALEPPKSIVVRFGRMGLIGEYPQALDIKPGCGSKLVAKTHRGIELVEVLTVTCENAGCGKSVTRKELRSYIDNSGGRDFPFYNRGRILRIATIEDLNEHSQLEGMRTQCVAFFKQRVAELDLPLKLVDVEPILGNEVLTFYYMSEDRVDFRQLLIDLAAEFHARIDLRQVGARDEARLVADYEKCGQHCCCKNFLKVLKPVSMRLAKEQKATLDPLKISGRCGRLMCCLRYEDETYRTLKMNLPHRKTRVGTTEGPGIVVDTKILVQLVLVKLEESGRQIAVPVEELIDPDECPTPQEIVLAKEAEASGLRGLAPDEISRRVEELKEAEGRDAAGPQRRRRRSSGSKEKASKPSEKGKPLSSSSEGTTGSPDKKKRRRRRRRKGSGGGGSGSGSSTS